MMIYVILDFTKYNREKVVSELKSEKYKHSFFISTDQDIKIKHKCMDLANEVWCFGDCEKMYDYKLAKKKGKDTWQMG